MKLATFIFDNQRRAGALTEQGNITVFEGDNDIGTLLERGTDLVAFKAMAAASRQTVKPADVTFLPPVVRPPKIICVGLNYAEHTKESPYEQPKYPTVFLRAATATGGHEAVIRRPLCSEQLDYEGEMVAVLSKGGRHISKERALDCVFGYAVGNEASVRDYQFKSPQWTVGKNFDGTGTWGPYLVTSDELPAGARGLRLQTRLNGKAVQSATTDDMIYDVASIISILSEAITLQAGDVIFTGTPAGVGLGHKPQLWLKHGDVVEVEIDGIGLLRNAIEDDKA